MFLQQGNINVEKKNELLSRNLKTEISQNSNLLAIFFAPGTSSNPSPLLFNLFLSFSLSFPTGSPTSSTVCSLPSPSFFGFGKNSGLVGYGRVSLAKYGCLRLWIESNRFRGSYVRRAERRERAEAGAAEKSMERSERGFGSNLREDDNDPKPCPSITRVSTGSDRRWRKREGGKAYRPIPFGRST